MRLALRTNSRFRLLRREATRHHVGSNLVSVKPTPTLPPIRCALADATGTKEGIETVCHRHLDSDIGESDLNSLPAFGTVPTSTAILSRSPGKYPILWRVLGSTFTHWESTLKLRTIVLGSYLNCTGCNLILHLQGLPNCKYDPAYPFTVEHPCDSTWNPAGRRLDISATNTILSPRAIPLRKRLGEYTNSEHDWASILTNTK